MRRTPPEHPSESSPLHEIAPVPPPVGSPRARPARSIETVLLASTACLLAAVAWPIAADGLRSPIEPVTILQPEATVDPAPVGDRSPRIQIALLLDTSGSMDGLIDQARSQLWSVVNALDGATFRGEAPRLEIALYEYGNDRLAVGDGWIRQVRGFTTELDSISEALFSLSTNGGSEHAGQVIARSIDELAWHRGDNVLRVLYIAGNETMHQGPVDYREAARQARERGIVVNTVLCGSPESSESVEWREAAELGGGRFLTIDHNHVVEYIAAPQDDEITALGLSINETYVRYGAQGREGERNQIAQDGNAGSYGAGSVVQRSVSKSSKLYDNGSWDLVDALESGKVGLAKVDRSTLPEALRSLDDAALEAHVEAQKKRRAQMQAQLAELAREREVWLQAERARRSGDDARSLDGAIVESIHEQARAAGFTLSEA
jgi:hypothetical protein